MSPPTTPTAGNNIWGRSVQCQQPYPSDPVIRFKNFVKGACNMLLTAAVAATAAFGSASAYSSRYVGATLNHHGARHGGRVHVGRSDPPRARSTLAMGLGVPDLSTDPRIATSRGMQAFRKGDVAGSLEQFDAAIAADERYTLYLWQRGLSLYYAGKFEEGAVQFRRDVAANPNDTEEAIWTFLCEAQTKGFEAARKQMLKVGKDSRPIMRMVNELFLGDASEEDLATAGHKAGPGR